MSSRTLLSRPRTRIYDANYNIGQNYYRSALDRLDQKHNPAAASSSQSLLAAARSPSRQRTPNRDFFDEELSTARRRAEKHITENNLLDSRSGRMTSQRALEFLESDIDEETAASLKRIRAQKKVSQIDDLDLEQTVNNINSRRLLDRSDKVLRSMGINENSRKALDEEITVKTRTLKISNDVTNDGDLVKWSALKPSEESAASIRAKQSRDRLIEMEDEMAALAERQQLRERRAARMRALVAESSEETQAAQTAIKAVSYRARREQRTIEE